jgi:uncharacterized protein
METKKITRRVFLKQGTRFLFSAASMASLLSVYSIYGESYWVQTMYVPLSFDRLPAAFSGLRMIQFSDVHLGHHYNLANFSNVVSTINQLRPDVICFTGDLYDADHGHPSEECVPLLSALKATYGKWAVLGNHDYRSGVPHKIVQLLEESGFELLKNNNRILERNGQRIRIAGVDDVIFGEPDLQQALKGGNDKDFTLLLAHEPDYADTAALYPVDLQISGHSHGGQIRLPWLGPIVTTEKGQKYVQGLYKIKESRLQVYTNRGIGMTYLPVRFLCRPEITVFTFKSI